LRPSRVFWRGGKPGQLTALHFLAGGGTDLYRSGQIEIPLSVQVSPTAEPEDDNHGGSNNGGGS